MIPFYAKIQIENTTGKNRFCIVATHISGENSRNARENVGILLRDWHDIKKFEILKISEYPIIMREFTIHGNLKYNTGSTKKFTYTLKSEDQPEAERIFKLISSHWKGIIQIEITEISKYNMTAQ